MRVARVLELRAAVGGTRPTCLLRGRMARARSDACGVRPSRGYTAFGTFAGPLPNRGPPGVGGWPPVSLRRRPQATAEARS
ncbi:hypothetical protein ACFPRL_12040 [Pseudoclavibacter helvolus]